jgi:hypothetical protein
MIVGCVQYPAGFDAASILRGFPDAYYLPPGHAPCYLEEKEVFEVSPAADLHQVIEVITTCRIDEHRKESS